MRDGGPQGEASGAVWRARGTQICPVLGRVPADAQREGPEVRVEAADDQELGLEEAAGLITARSHHPASNQRYDKC